jgi:predicted acylesterase/phospholipase RssA
MTSEQDKPVCGLVMKGGVSSGVVYPPAVLELKDHYRFNQIAGNSAGAIAAAATAAAQLGERKKGAKAPNQGFAGLKVLSDDLGRPGFVFKLFQPQETFRKAWDFFHSKPSRPNFNKALGELKIAGIYYLLSMFLLCTAGLIFVEQRGLIIGLLFALHLMVVVMAFLIVRAYQTRFKGHLDFLEAVKLFEKSPVEYFFGVCSGGPMADKSEVKPMTVWLHERFQEMAGQDKVLTFNDLEGGDIQLRMLSTALTHQKPLGLPFKDRVFLFREKEMKRLFPADVVDHLINESYKTKEDGIDCTILNAHGYYFLPGRRDLPVVVATRLSLSVPILFCAVPLYTPDFGKRKGSPWTPSPDDLQRSWFTDGGVSCNFPVEVFDEWLPTQPIFGISLGAQEAKKSPEESVRRAKPSGFTYLQRTRIRSLKDFVNAVVATTMDHADNAHAELAGSRDRVVEIGLTSDEGGFNLKMGKTELETMQNKGAVAGRNLQSADFEDHLWVRLRLFLATLSKESQDFSKADFQALLDRAQERMKLEKDGEQKNNTLSYKPDNPDEWFLKAKQVLQLLSGTDEMGTGQVLQYKGFRKGAPAAVAGLQVRPRIIGDLPADS